MVTRREACIMVGVVVGALLADWYLPGDDEDPDGL